MVEMAVDSVGMAQREFRIGKVLSRAFSIFSAHFVTFSMVSGFVWLPVAMVGFLNQGTAADQQGFVGLVTLIVALFVQPLATAIILYAAFQHMRGLPVRLGESISRGLSRFLPLLGLMLLSTLGVGLGLALFIIPGIILMVMWYVAVPVCVVERGGPVSSLGRSQELTKGHRWKLFGLYILIFLASLIGGSLLPVGAAAVAGGAGALIAQVIWQGIAQAFGSVLIVVAYHDLRVAKEGIDIERIAVVFD